MVIHLYTICKSEEELLPFFYNHYKEFVTEITVLYDISSTDSSSKVIDSLPKCNRIDFNTGGKVRDDILMLMKNSIWKQSKGQSDWVIVVDIDELLYCKDGIKNVLQDYKNRGITIPLVEGFDMFSDSMPNLNQKITTQIKTGVFNNNFSKKIVFNPNEIKEINYLPGAHKCEPEGNVNFGTEQTLKLLHYKHIGGLKRLTKRWITYGDNLSQINIKKGWGVKRKDPEVIVKRFNKLKDQAKEII